jgi:hypothetical protein
MDSLPMKGAFFDTFHELSVFQMITTPFINMIMKQCHYFKGFSDGTAQPGPAPPASDVFQSLVLLYCLCFSK